MLGDGLSGGTVVLPGLFRKPEEDEEDDGADKNEPTCRLEGGSDGGPAPEHCGVLPDERKVDMGVLPTFPGFEVGGVGIDGIDAEGESGDVFNAGEHHEAEVSTNAEVVVC